MNEERRLVVGFVRSPHGITGEFKVESASGRYEHIEALKEVTLRNGSAEKRFSVLSSRSGNGTLYMKLADIDSPEDVQKYRNWEIVVPERYANKPGKDEWYIEDLKNCSLIWSGDGTAAGTAPTQTVGTITDVLEGGTGYLLEVSISESCECLSDELKRTSSGKARKVFIPLNYRYISDVDVCSKTVRLMHLWILE